MSVAKSTKINNIFTIILFTNKLANNNNNSNNV